MVYGARTPPRCVLGDGHIEHSTDDCSAARALTEGERSAQQILQEWERKREVGRVLVGVKHGNNFCVTDEGPLSGGEI